jgi:glycolate oxidase
VEEANFGHVGDGNVHVNILFPEEREGWHETLDALLDELYTATADMGGTLSGEHGIGLKRQKYMCRVMDRAQMDLIWRVKLAFDPNNILNPGKMISCPGRDD